MTGRGFATKRTSLRIPVAFALLCCFYSVARADQAVKPVVVFQETGFPSADSSAPSGDLASLVPGATIANLEAFRALLKDPATRLCVLPYGSAFPENAWRELYLFLRAGGNLLVIGGRPFTRAAYKDASGAWKLRDYSVRFIKELRIDQYQETPGSNGLEFETNPDVVTKIPQFAWKRAFSPVIRLSEGGLYARGGTAGFVDARLDTLAWGVRDKRRLAAPAIQIDHIRDAFTGSRWVFLNSDLPQDFLSSTGANIVPALAQAALRGAENFGVWPVLPLYASDESIELQVERDVESPASGLSAHVVVQGSSAQGGETQVFSTTVALPQTRTLSFRIPSAKGFYIVSSELYAANQLLAVHHSGFWIRDDAYLRSGPKLAVNADYFELDGKPLPVVGTTYMSSDVQRLFFDHPNVFVWDRDLAEIQAAGLNMIRTGWWTGWDKLFDENGRPYERTLRTIEAYLMTARKHGLPVQFNFFAFLPDVVAGRNAYLDPDAVRRQRTIVSAVAARLQGVPFVAWDLINEPSFSRQLWRTRPNGDAIENEKWNAWLAERYPDRGALADAWNLPLSSAEGPQSVPGEQEFDPRGMYSGPNSLRVYDFVLFAQESFAGWVKQLRDAVREKGPALITVGQDEGGYMDRLTPAFFGSSVDFTTTHSWWQNDALLWDSLVAKQPGKPMLVQETGLQRELTLDEIARRTPQNEGALFERKMAMSFAHGAGAIEWLWNTNSYMTEGNEVPIGALRTDGTEKPEASVLRGFASFAKEAGPFLRKPERARVAMVLSEASQYSALVYQQIGAQQNAVRALAYYARTPAYTVAENQIRDNLGNPKLVILPSPQALTEKAWQALLEYVDAGGNLLISGSIDRDEHWHQTARAGSLTPNASSGPITFHHADMNLGSQAIPVTFDQNAQAWFEYVHFSDGATLREIPRGKGKIFWAAFPVELSSTIDSTAALYASVLEKSGVVSPWFELKRPLSSGVLVFPVALEEATLYLFSSETRSDSEIDLVDKRSGGKLAFRLPSEHAALVIVRKSDGTIAAKYGF